MPDVNLLTMTETLEAARHINNAVGIPVIADCDNGYGNAVNVVRTVEEYERAGIAGLCLEDNVFPKKCSLYPGDPPGAGLRRGARRQDPRGQAGPARPGHGHHRPDRGAHRRLGHGGGAAPGPRLRRGRRRHDPHPLQGAHGRRGAEFMRCWDGATPIVAVPTLYPAWPGRSWRGRRQARHLGEPGAARGRRGHAGHAGRARPRAAAGRPPSPHRAAGGDLSPASGWTTSSGSRASSCRGAPPTCAP